MNSLRSVANFAAGVVALVALALTSHAARNPVHTAEKPAAAGPVRKPLLHYGELPLGFEPNLGQADSRVQFLSRGRGYTLTLSGGEAVLTLRRANGDQPAILADGLSHREPTHDGIFLNMRLAGANPHASPEGMDEFAGKTNYLIGNDPSKWRLNVANYGAVRYDLIYPGTNLVYYGNQGRLEYDFVVAPGASVGPIGWSFTSRRAGSAAESTCVPEIDANGDLVLTIDGARIQFDKPIAYQLPREVPDWLVMTKSGRTFSHEAVQRISVESRWVMRRDGRVGFETGPYDHSRALVIDPTLAYSTFLGGSSFDAGSAIAVDSSGNAYVTGGTYSTDFPLAGNSLLNQCRDCAAGEATVFVSKFNADGSALDYSTYIGGTGYGSGFMGDVGYGIAVDAQGNAYVAGTAMSADFPVTPGALKTTCTACATGSTNAFVLKLNAAGSGLLYSTYLGGTGTLGDSAQAIATDSSGHAYVTGYTHSADFPISAGAFQTICKDCTNGIPDSFISKLSPDGSSLIYSTYLGGSNLYGEGGNGDIAHSIAVDASGEAFVAGEADTHDFPTTSGAFQGRGQSGSTGFAAKINSDATALIYSTGLGGSINGSIQAIAIDTSGNAYVAGTTTSADFPVTPGAYQRSCSATCDDAFVSKLNPQGSALVFSTFLGETDIASGIASGGIAVDSNGNSYVTGETRSSDFPVTSNTFQALCDQTSARCSGDAFLTEVNSSGSDLVYSTFLGGKNEDAGVGIALDSSNSVYIAGYTSSANFPVSSNAFQKNCGANCITTNLDLIAYDAFVAKFGTTTSSAPSVSLSATALAFGNQAVGSASSPQSITLTNTGNTTLSALAIIVTGANSGDFTQTNACGTSVAAGASCSINFTFKPSASGSRSASIQISDNAASSPQTISLSGTGTAAGAPSVSLSATSVAFGNQAVGSASSPQSITLTNTGNASLDSLAITVGGANSGDFTQANACGTSVAAGASCSISVTFKPAASGSRSASIQISDNAASSPQTAALSGTGTSGLGLAISSGSSSTATVTAGSTATYALTLGGAGFSGTVALTCSGPPQKSTCSIPGSMTVSATSASAVQVSVSTTASSVAQLDRPLGTPLVLGTSALALLFLPRRIRRKASLQILGVMVIAAAVLSLSGCGGAGSLGGSRGGGGQAGTPSGTYTLTVTASAGSLNASKQLTLTVQ